ncbi:MAG: hypothetical protein QX190_12340, partial [Methylococcales bacterium]
EKLTEFNHSEFNTEHAKHWQIEQYHRAIKQVCNIENFQVRGKQAIRIICLPPFVAMFNYNDLHRCNPSLIVIKFDANCSQMR